MPVVARRLSWKTTGPASSTNGKQAGLIPAAIPRAQPQAKGLVVAAHGDVIAGGVCKRAERTGHEIASTRRLRPTADLPGMRLCERSASLENIRASRTTIRSPVGKESTMKPAKRGRAEVPQEHYGDQAQGDSRTRTPATTGLRPHPITPITQIRCTSQQGTARRASQPTMQSNLKRSQTNFRMLSGLRRLHRGLRWMSCTIGPWAIGKVNQDSLSRLSTATLNPPNASGRPMADRDRRWICSWSPPSISAYRASWSLSGEASSASAGRARARHPIHKWRAHKNGGHE
jgi:hypothetical protein